MVGNPVNMLLGLPAMLWCGWAGAVPQAAGRAGGGFGFDAAGFGHVDRRAQAGAKFYSITTSCRAAS